MGSCRRVITKRQTRKKGVKDKIKRSWSNCAFGPESSSQHWLRVKYDYGLVQSDALNHILRMYAQLITLFSLSLSLLAKQRIMHFLVLTANLPQRHIWTHVYHSLPLGIKPKPSRLDYREDEARENKGGCSKKTCFAHREPSLLLLVWMGVFSLSRWSPRHPQPSGGAGELSWKSVPHSRTSSQCWRRAHMCLKLSARGEEKEGTTLLYRLFLTYSFHFPMAHSIPEQRVFTQREREREGENVHLVKGIA